VTGSGHAAETGAPARPLRIVEMVSGIDINGAVRAALMLSRALAARGHEVTLVHAPGAWIAGQLGGAGIRPVETAFGRNPAELRRLSGIVRDLRPDVIHTHRTGASNVGVRLGRATGVPVVATLHSGKPQFHWLGNDRMIALSARTFRLVRMLHPFSRGRIALVPNFIEAPPPAEAARRAGLRRAFGIGAGTFVVGYLGVVGPEKRPRDLVAALARLAATGIDCHLFLIGVDWAGESARVARQVAAGGLGARVTLTGLREDGRALLALFDAYATASAREEMSLSVMEAMAEGLPVVATDVGSLPLLVAGGGNGFLVRVGDVDAIAGGLLQLARSPDLRRAMGAASLERITAYAPGRVVPRIEAVLAEAASRR
jgi:glycosyltransferase involved in cell wall biosynthesis